MRIILFLTVVVLFTPGCQKDDFINQLSFKLDGEQIICNSSISSNESDYWLYSILDLYGEFDYNPDNLHPEYIQITLRPFDENKHEYLIRHSNQSDISLYLNKDGGHSYFALYTGIIIIEELSASHIKGTFECIAQPGGPGGTDSLTITEGKFNIRRG